MQPDIPRFFTRFAWLFYLFTGLLLYTLGAGMARYLGARLDPGVHFLGQLWVLSLVMFADFLLRHFDDRAAAENLGRVLLRFLPWKTAMLTGAVIAATLAASATLALIQLGVLTQGTWTLMLLAVAGACIYTLPPVRWVHSGYGELLVAALVAAGIPALGFMVQYGAYHHYLAMVSFPLGALQLSMQIALGLPGFAAQQKYELRTLVMRMGWENAMAAHNMLILGAFLLIAVSALFNFPSFAVYPVLVVFPLGVLQVYAMLRIAAGGRPHWNALAVSAAALFAVPAYLLTLAFWTH